MKTSLPKSISKYLQLRYLLIVLAALILSLVLFWALRLPDKTNENPLDETADVPVKLAAEQSESTSDTMIGVQPASFRQITEFKAGAAVRLRLAGESEANAVIVLTNRGKPLRQVRVNDLGQWGATLDVETGPMVIEAQLYTDENITGIRSEETVFRLSVPEGKEAITANYKTSALIMVTAPGSPSRVIQSPYGEMPTSGPLGLSVIDYDYSGGIIITGSSSVPGRIRIYAQDAVIGETGIGVSGRWNYIAGRMLPRGQVVIRAELIAAEGIPNAPEGPISISVPFNFLPPLQENETDGSGALSVIIEPLHWQVRRTLIGGGGQTTVVFAPTVEE